MAQIRFKNDLDFLATYWDKAKEIGTKITNELPQTKIAKHPLTKGKLSFIMFSELTSWSVDDLNVKINGHSKTLVVLANKINYMIEMGRANDVKPMIQKIVTQKVKTLYHPRGKAWSQSGGNKRESLGKGHFRWNFGAHTLNAKEIEHLKNFFNIN